MHELAIMQGVVRVCEREAAKEGFGRVESITLSEGAKLITRLIPAAVECPDCGYAGPIRGTECPRCGGYGYRLTHGREFYIESLEVE